MIESIHIKNFRGIQDGKIDRFSKINLLVGPNNSGKSAVLETIYLANTASQPAAIETLNARYDARTASRDLLGFDPLERICEKHLKAPATNVTSGSISKKWRRAGFTLHGQTSQNADPCKIALCSVEPKDEITFKKIGLSLAEIAAEMDWLVDNGFVDEPRSIGAVTMFWEGSLTYYQEKESAWWLKGMKPSSKNTLLYDVSTSLAHLPFEYFREMLGAVPGWTHKIAKSFERIFQLNQKFNVTFLQLQHDMSQTQGFIAPEDKVALTIDDYGDGARSAFKLLTPLIALAELVTEEEPGVFIWEEPELFQNPLTIGKLLREIVDLINGKPIQIFIASHNLDLVAHFTAMVLDGCLKPEDLMTFRLNLDEKSGQLTSSWFNMGNLKTWMEEGLDPRVWGEFKSPLHFRFQEDGE